jgi:putative membrane protein
MNELILSRYLHFIGIFAIVAAIVGQHLLIKDELKRSEIKRLTVLDTIYGAGAILVLIVGLTLWFRVGKPAEFYTKNWIFHLKVTLFVLLGLLSIIPTVFFLKNKKGDPEELVKIPKRIVMVIRTELLLLFIMPLLASLMAYGVGKF